MKSSIHTLIAAAMLMPAAAFAGDYEVPMHKVTEDGKLNAIGTIKVEETEYGTVFTPKLSGLMPGEHGFHVHQNPSCQPADGKPAGAAGSHYDPHEAGKHAAPWEDGHLGDLPTLSVNEEGDATTPVLAPKVKFEDLEGRALMIHSGGDNYADEPKPLGGGGSRVACGVVK
ncbi:superoxide dismutase [Cu-Zn] SodC [Gilvimarinus xylanilyticus]|uniref:Superoxide dismutase [Cu-Zn] n=1 Tax=Gilvimarinus xylanilyticus TaxID=2944139 RepID=A0A9X2I1C2_9GAMM|nr:superoxide dismutase [Cu-Zn] SodC [Gilvimarinus xylanilyticus]MCP8900331.1 superoxide dismutase [Cu-Zn] SodC [Gilvimarinus xylanilyticus]